MEAKGVRVKVYKTKVRISREESGTTTEEDLRWNSLSRVGGIALLESLQHNHTLTKLSLTGNNVPPDIISTIDAQVNQNAQLFEVQQEYTSQANLLKKQMEEQEQHSLCHVEHLERSLAERDRTINTTLRLAPM
ncbi:hypothetical protein Pcinc_001255 [Petrolisthes cinctipes]|uniref:Uncharacterized protein n=1 Tax=Petrolisthes cinctipes TaxID=88211 RepID=A0AAE1GN59_PETCI|nr:hypothetical protein Pcinc_001255 [Petrolisthes cinctipes]